MTNERRREWFRGVLEPCLLALMAGGETYGYQLAGRLEQAGFGPVAGGSLYPALLRLENQGLVTSRWKAGDGGPGRKYYQLSAKGRRELAAVGPQWAAFSAAVGAVLQAGARP